MRKSPVFTLAFVPALFFCIAQAALAQAVFVGATTPDANGARGWFDTLVTPTSCGIAQNIVINNWGQSWCSAMPPTFTGPVNVSVNLNGFHVNAFSDTRATSLLTPAGGIFGTGGIASH